MSGRILKFRGWDESNKVMHNDVEFIRSGIEGNDWILFKSDKRRLEDGEVLDNPYFSQQIKLMQYTGLKDKNGIEIYEGDILNGFGDSVKGVIRWSNEDAAFLLSSIFLHSNSGAMLGAEYTANFEVVGNIYEDEQK